MIERGELQARADALAWYHSIDLGQGVVTKGLSDPATRLTAAQLPDFAACSVLDVGAWDGYYSFLAERAGASRVVALDHYAWGVDIAAREGYWEECRDNGTLPDQTRDTTDFWRPDLPGRRGFDLAHEVFDSKVETVVADFTTVDLETVGVFDVVLYLGVLYHMKEPLTCLERVRAVTRQVAVIETAAVRFPQAQGEALLRFHAGSELNRDFGNWYQPTIEALVALARAAGFARVDVVQGPPPAPRPTLPRSLRARIRPPVQAPPPAQQYRAIIHAFV